MRRVKRGFLCWFVVSDGSWPRLHRQKRRRNSSSFLKKKKKKKTKNVARRRSSSNKKTKKFLTSTTTGRRVYLFNRSLLTMILNEMNFGEFDWSAKKMKEKERKRELNEHKRVYLKRLKVRKNIENEVSSKGEKEAKAE